MHKYAGINDRVIKRNHRKCGTEALSTNEVHYELVAAESYSR